MGQQRIRQLQRQAATPTTAPPAQKPFSWQRPFPVPEQNTVTSAPQPIPDLQARLEILRRANPDWSKVKASSNPAKAVQAKLAVGAPNDQYEQEADRVADQVMSMPDGATKQPVQREAAPEEDELQTKPLAASITPLVQRDMAPDEEEVQPKLAADMLQREAMPEEEEIQPKLFGSIQRAEMPEEEEVQTKPLAHSIQREATPEEELQTKPLGNGMLQREAIPEEEEEPVQAKLSGAADIQPEAMPEEEEALQTKPLANTSIQREALPEEEEPLQTKQSPTPYTPHPTPSLESQLSNTQGSGSPLPDDVRSFMEPRFGADFSQVRVHTSSESVQMNRDLNAQAFTHKQDVYFGAGKAPGKDALTAHELTHVVQQSGKLDKLNRSSKWSKSENGKKNNSSSEALKENSGNLRPSFPLLQSYPLLQRQNVPGGGATPGQGNGIDVIFIVRSPKGQASKDNYTEEVTKYIKTVLQGAAYWEIDSLEDIFRGLYLVRVANAKVRRLRIVAHGSTTGDVKMKPEGEKKRRWYKPDEVNEYSKKPGVAELVKNVLTPDAVIEFWGCNLGKVASAGQAWSNLFQHKFKATTGKFSTGSKMFYRSAGRREGGKKLIGKDGKYHLYVRVKKSEEVDQRGEELQKDFKEWLLNVYQELVKNGDVLPIEKETKQLEFMRSLFDRSGGDIRNIEVVDASDPQKDPKRRRRVRPGDQNSWAELWTTFSPSQ